MFLTAIFLLNIVIATTQNSQTIALCQSKLWMCKDGVCLEEDYRCDGDNDCRDKSDEENCGRYKHNVCYICLDH
ncbi:hypothetical protein Btru_058008 [Bulinus truncatus]|nr:hypothetical protein Btru_058008 [Bulinus truncatus]